MRLFKSIEYCFEYLHLMLKKIRLFFWFQSRRLPQAAIIKENFFRVSPHTGDAEKFRQDMLKYAKPTRELQVQPGGQEPEPITKISGQPWWPEGIERPKCKHGHYMNFVAQVLLSDVPGLSLPDNTLLSFHYCDTCTMEGRMPFGWEDKQNRGYDISILQDIDKRKPDSRGFAAAQYGTSYKVTFREINEVPAYEDAGIVHKDIPKDYPQGKDDFDENIYPGLQHVARAKIGGWPNWVQYPTWPCDDNGKNYEFIAQYDWMLFDNSAWAGGGYAYLFIIRETDSKIKGELIIQTT
jgi:uncharacterized protein YwqG